jgi:hypothetical protein
LTATIALSCASRAADFPNRAAYRSLLSILGTSFWLSTECNRDISPIEARQVGLGQGFTPPTAHRDVTFRTDRARSFCVCIFASTRCASPKSSPAS